MWYWFEEHHTLVLARARIDLRNPGKRDYAQNRIPLAERALAPALLAARTEICSGF